MRMLGHNFGSDWGAGEGARKSRVIRAMATADADVARDRSGLRAATRTPSALVPCWVATPPRQSSQLREKIGLASSYCSLPNTLYFCFPKCSLCRGCSDCALALTMHSTQATCRKYLGTRGRNSAGICSIINRNRLVGALHATACIMCVEGAERPLPSRGLLHAIMKNSDRLVGIQNHTCKIFPISRGARSAPRSAVFNAAGWAWDMKSDLLMALAQGLFGCL